MAAKIGDTHRLERMKGSEPIPSVPYATRGAGLYSEVSWDPVTSLRARAARPKTGIDAGSQPVAPA